MRHGWRRADLEADQSWRSSWRRDEVDALLEWVDSSRQAAVLQDPASIGEHLDDAPVVLRDKADHIRHELIDGRGLALITGFPVGNLDHRTVGLSYVLFGALVGSLRSQNAAGHLLGHVTDVGADVEDPNVRIYQTNQRQTFHTDSTDAVSLLCLKTALQGGESMVVSVDAVHAEIQRRNPGLAARLFEPIATDRRGEVPPGQQPWFEIPVLSRSGDRITGLYQRQYIDSCARFEDAPRPDDEHIAALDLFDEVMNDPEFFATMPFEPGDMQFVHNHSLMHDRSGFVDHDDPTRRRHLLRLWLSLPGDRMLPESFRQRYGSITVGDRGGISVAETRPTIALSA